MAVLLVALSLVESATAHAPTTAIGRVVEAFGSVPVSYDQGAMVSDVEAANFGPLVGSNPKVAFMPASAASEIAGGPNAIASEIADEANLDGTLIVLAGEKLGAWSDEIGDDRLLELVSAARSEKAGGSFATMVRSLVRGVQAEPVDAGPPWGLIGAVPVALAVGSLAAFDRLVRRRP